MLMKEITIPKSIYAIMNNCKEETGYKYVAIFYNNNSKKICIYFDKLNNLVKNNLKEFIEKYDYYDTNFNHDLKFYCSLDNNNDMVNQPNHYKTKSYECRNVMNELLERITDGKEAYNFGNIFKYIWRYKTKNGVEDLKKAENYLKDLINYMEAKLNENEK